MPDQKYKAVFRARQLLAQPPELVNARDLRLALQQLLDAMPEPPGGGPPSWPERNVRCTVEIEMCVPDVSSAPVPEKWKDNPGYVAWQATQLDEASYDRVQSIVHGIIEAGDPDDVYDMTVVVSAKLASPGPHG